MAPVVAIAPLLMAATAAASAGVGIYSAVQSNKQAKEAEKRQAAYNAQLKADQEATAAKEKQLAADAKARSRAYGSSLVDSGTQLNNMLSGGYDDEDYVGGSVLGSSLGSADVSSMFA